MDVALFFGSFNPIHIGHLALANHVCEFGGMDELWFVVSPQNPFKQDACLMDDDLRLRMVEAAIAGYPRFRTCDVEFRMPRPSYTVHTLECLRTEHPHTMFHLLMGADNWLGFAGWHRPADILAHHPVLVYPRPGCEVSADDLPEGVRLIDAPLMEISSTYIREALSRGHDVRYFLHPAVWRQLQGAEGSLPEEQERMR